MSDHPCKTGLGCLHILGPLFHKGPHPGSLPYRSDCSKMQDQALLPPHPRPLISQRPSPCVLSPHPTGCSSDRRCSRRRSRITFRDARQLVAAARRVGLDSSNWKSYVLDWNCHNNCFCIESASSSSTVNFDSF